MPTYYKFLTNNHTGQYSGFSYAEYLPKRGKAGKWLPKIDNIEMCESGYHVCLKKNIEEWMNDDLYIVEIRGKKFKGDNKIVAQELRLVKHVTAWNEKNLRLAAAEIVKRIALPVWKKDHPDDTSMEDVIDTVIRYANGKATDTELAAARDAARDAAWAGAAARDAARGAARGAAWAAAWVAARDAAWAAARAAAGAAAGAAARAAARGAARGAARAAARGAARAAARGAARAAAVKIIYKKCGL